MVFDIGDGWAVLVSIATWLTVSLAVGWWYAHRSLDKLAVAGPFTKLRRWEVSGTWWHRRLGVRRWKDRLPEAGALFAGGHSKRRLPSGSAGGLERFRRETIRAERVHWLIMATAAVHVLWCRPAVAAGMVLFGVLFNAPFIIVQRSNRARVENLISRRRAAASGDAIGADPMVESQ